MKRLSIFSLEAVIRYSDKNLRGIFLQLVNDISQISLTEDPDPETRNLQELLMLIFKKELQREPSKEEIEQYQKGFKAAVKKIYLDDEDAFEVRPGVQSLFAQLEKEKKWKYGIISDLWGDTTQFLLQACGIFSKNKLTICAEDAPNRKKQSKLLIERVQKGHQNLKLHYICLHEAPSFLSENFKVLSPKGSKKENNYYVYPKFSEMFGHKKKKRKKAK